MFGNEIGVLAHPIARTFDLDDHGVVKEPVEERGGDNRIAEDVTPFGKATIGGEDHRALFVTGVDELKEQVAAARCDGQVADLVDDKQRTAAQEPYFVPQNALTFGFSQDGDEIGQRDEVDAFAGANGLDGERGCEMRFSGAGWPEQMNDLGTVDEVETGERHDPVAVERGLEREVEAGQGLDNGQPGHSQCNNGQ